MLSTKSYFAGHGEENELLGLAGLCLTLFIIMLLDKSFCSVKSERMDLGLQVFVLPCLAYCKILLRCLVHGGLNARLEKTNSKATRAEPGRIVSAASTTFSFLVLPAAKLCCQGTLHFSSVGISEASPGGILLFAHFRAAVLYVWSKMPM